MGFLKEYKAGIIRITLKATNSVEVFGEMECGIFWPKSIYEANFEKELHADLEEKYEFQPGNIILGITLEDDGKPVPKGCIRKRMKVGEALTQTSLLKDSDRSFHEGEVEAGFNKVASSVGHAENQNLKRVTQPGLQHKRQKLEIRDWTEEEKKQRAEIAAKKAAEEATHKKAKAARAKKRAAKAAGESASESSDGNKPAGWQGKFALDVAAERKKRKGNPSTPKTPKAPKANPNPNNARDDQLTWQSRGQLVQKLGSIKVLRTTWQTLQEQWRHPDSVFTMKSASLETFKKKVLDWDKSDIFNFYKEKTGEGLNEDGIALRKEFRVMATEAVLMDLPLVCLLAKEEDHKEGELERHTASVMWTACREYETKSANKIPFSFSFCIIKRYGKEFAMQGLCVLGKLVVSQTYDASDMGAPVSINMVHQSVTKELADTYTPSLIQRDLIYAMLTKLSSLSEFMGWLVQVYIRVGVSNFVVHNCFGCFPNSGYSWGSNLSLSRPGCRLPRIRGSPCDLKSYRACGCWRCALLRFPQAAAWFPTLITALPLGYQTWLQTLDALLGCNARVQNQDTKTWAQHPRTKLV